MTMEADRIAILGVSAAIRRMQADIATLGPTDVRVLIVGETGTGKELAAEALHRTSRAASGPFVAVNCGELTGGLAASALFGHRRGAFTGAINDHVGACEAASGGTLFLDEIGDLAPDVQVMILRVLERLEFTPLGAEKARPFNARVLSATHRPVREMMRTGAFRADLYHRLSQELLEIEPLRDRPEDVEPLTRAFLRRAAEANGLAPVVLTPEAVSRLRMYSWPGNVRELANVSKSLAIHAAGREVGAVDIADRLHQPRAERDRIVDLLVDCRGNVTVAAARIGIQRQSLHRRMRELGIPVGTGRRR
jgi:two-component system NtrC family response regulator